MGTVRDRKERKDKDRPARDMEPPNFKWALDHVAIMALPDHPKMYQWLLDQQITKLYSLHPMVPKQIKGTPKLENEHFKKYPYEQLTCDELEKFIEIIETAKLFGKRIAFHDDTGCNHAAMVIAAYLQREHPEKPEVILERINSIQPGSIQQSQQKNRLFEFYQRLNIKGGGISGHFFPEDPSVEVFGPVGGRAKCREYAPHSMLTCKGRWWPEQNYKAMM